MLATFVIHRFYGHIGQLITFLPWQLAYHFQIFSPQGESFFQVLCLTCMAYSTIGSDLQVRGVKQSQHTIAYVVWEVY